MTDPHHRTGDRHHGFIVTRALAHPATRAGDRRGHRGGGRGDRRLRIIRTVRTPGRRGGRAAPAAAGTSVPTSDVPVGGGLILTEQKVVITQPTAGTFKAFTAVCTHQGCLVATVADGNISCPCHGSTYSISDGSVTRGPATSPLAPVPTTSLGATITVA